MYFKIYSESYTSNYAITVYLLMIDFQVDRLVQENRSVHCSIEILSNL